MERKTVWTMVGTALGVLVLMTIGFLAFVYSGIYNVSASEPHTAVGRWTLNTMAERSVQERAEEMDPAPPIDSSMVAAGFTRFRSRCVVCHGGPGQQPTDYSRAMRPQPPILQQTADRWSENELFQIVKHGFKLSGMPAWGEIHSDEEIWEIVALVRQLPSLDSAGYAQMEGAAPTEASATDAGEPRDEGTAAATVGMTDDLRFDPSEVRIQEGQTVTWRNSSELVHTVTADPELAADESSVALPNGADTFDSGNLQPGETFSHTFTVPGTYKYFCIPHELQGMIATVVVERAD